MDKKKKKINIKDWGYIDSESHHWKRTHSIGIYADNKIFEIHFESVWLIETLIITLMELLKKEREWLDEIKEEINRYR